MKRIYLISIILVSVLGLVSTDLSAGNWQRAGSAGASQLLINPWARSSSWGGANVACVTGYESMHLNVAGLAFTKKLEVGFNNSQYLVGSGIQVNAAALAYRVGENSVLGASVEAFSWGEIDKTSELMPEGGFGTYKPGYTVIGLSYAREFSNSIFGGITVKIINEHIDNLKASGFALDAGIQYITGFGKDKAGNRIRDNIHFGITMKNVGTTMKYTGDGMSFVGVSPTGTSMSVENRSQEFELPSLIKIGFSYHVKLAPKIDEDETVYSNHNLAIALNFTSNSFTKDQFHIGLEYSFMEYLFVRGGYTFEKGLYSVSDCTTAFSGPSLGVSVQAPLKKKEEGTRYGVNTTSSNTRPVIGFDYSYRFTNILGGVHTFGVRITM